MNSTPSSAFRAATVASALAVAFAISAEEAGAQTATQLAPGIRNFDVNAPTTLTAVPQLLSQTGLYRNIGTQATRAISDTSVTAFQVNSALWSDGSHKERFISLLPGTKVAPNDTAKFTFPDGAVLIKNFQIDTVHGDHTGGSRIFVETRFLVYQVGPSGKNWSGLSYRWRRDQTDADLVHPDSGQDYIHNVVLNGMRVGKRWRYPKSDDCAQCHKGDESMNRGSLGFITPQLNRTINGTNQLQSLFARGILSANPVAGRPNAHRWYGLTDTATLEQRVRSYFASNCSHCHGYNFIPGGAKQDFDYFSPNRRIIYQYDSTANGDPLGGWVGMPSLSGGDFAWLVLPGYPDSSVITAKMKHRIDDHIFISDTEQMPPLATSQPDSAAVALIEQWICSLKAGTPCGRVPWQADETFWGEEVAATVRPEGKLKGPAFQSSLRRGLLSVPAHLAAAGVQLWDYRGRKVDLVSEGEGRFRIAGTLTPGVYLLAAGRHRLLLNHIP